MFALKFKFSRLTIYNDNWLVGAVSFSLLDVYNRLTAIWQCIQFGMCSARIQKNKQKHSCWDLFLIFSFEDFQIFTQYSVDSALYGCSIEKTNQSTDAYFCTSIHLNFYYLIFDFNPVIVSKLIALTEAYWWKQNSTSE